MIREVVLDTETTGVDRNEDRIIEIGAVELIDRLPTGRTFHAYCNPAPRRSNPHAFAVHKLSDSFLARKPPFEDCVPELLAFIGDAPLVIHNAPFDVGMLNKEFARMFEGPPPIDISRAIDTMPLAKRRVPGRRSYKLDGLLEHFKIDASSREGRHGALIDAELLARLYYKLAGLRQESLGFELGAPAGYADTAQEAPAERRAPRSRITAEEAARHAAFVSELGASAVWLDYLGSAE